MTHSDPAAVLLADIADDPDDDLSRQILGDLLADRGDPRGEFLQVEMQLRAGNADAEQRKHLEQRRRALLGRHALEWLGPFADAARRWEFQRGFLHLEIPAERLSEELLEHPCGVWVEQLRILDCHFRLRDTILEGLLQRATSLQFCDDLNLASLVGRLFLRTHTPRLRRLHLEGGMFPTPALHRLALYHARTRLTELTFSHHTITGHHVDVLQASRWDDLRRLVLRHCSIAEEDAARLTTEFPGRVFFRDD
jgi:uncharacterized protein (TIGR02996 family)